jgi:hypothetical protein
MRQHFWSSRSAALILIAAGCASYASAQAPSAQTPSTQTPSAPAPAAIAHHLESDSGSWSQYRGNARRTAFAPWRSAAEPSILWRLELGPMIDASPVIGPDGTIYLVGPKTPVWPMDQLIAVNPDGVVRWKTILDGFRLRATPAVRDDGSIVAVGYNIYVDRIVRDSTGNITKVFWKREAKVFLVGADRTVLARTDLTPFFNGPGLSSSAYASAGTMRTTGISIPWPARI